MTENQEKSKFIDKESKWLEQAINHLENIEKTSLQWRTQANIDVLTEVINSTLKLLNISQTNLSLLQNISEMYKNEFNDNINQCLNDIRKWDGLQITKLKSMPKNFKDYKKRAMNWLRHNRPTNYTNELYPKLVIYSIDYISKVCIAVYSNDIGLENWLKDILINKYLAELFLKKLKIENKGRLIDLIFSKSLTINISIFNLLLKKIMNNNYGNLKENIKFLKDNKNIYDSNLKYIFKNCNDASKYFHNKYNIYLTNNNNTPTINEIPTNNNNDKYMNICNINNFGYGSHRQLINQINTNDMFSISNYNGIFSDISSLF